MVFTTAHQINPVHTIPSYLSKILVVSTHLCLGLSSGFFYSGFPTKIIYTFLPMYATFPIHHRRSDYILRSVMDSSIHNFFHSPTVSSQLLMQCNKIVK
jgi:hypothetical protein